MDKAEAIKRIEDHIRVHRIGEYPHIKIAEALNMAISALANDNNVGSKWIPVSERLPEDMDQRVLVKIKDANNIVGHPDMDTDRYRLNNWVRWGGFVTHWMPLPEPPKED